MDIWKCFVKNLTGIGTFMLGIAAIGSSIYALPSVVSTQVNNHVDIDFNSYCELYSKLKKNGSTIDETLDSVPEKPTIVDGRVMPYVPSDVRLQLKEKLPEVQSEAEKQRVIEGVLKGSLQHYEKGDDKAWKTLEW